MKRKEEHIKADGEITQTLGYENFRVRLENGTEILCSVSGRMRNNHIKIMTGDMVQIELSPYDLTRGRIVYRYRTKR